MLIPVNGGACPKKTGSANPGMTRVVYSGWGARSYVKGNTDAFNAHTITQKWGYS